MHQVVALLFSSSILSDFLGCPVDLRSGCGISCVGECGGSESWVDPIPFSASVHKSWESDDFGIDDSDFDLGSIF